MTLSFVPAALAFLALLFVAVVLVRALLFVPRAAAPHPAAAQQPAAKVPATGNPAADDTMGDDAAGDEAAADSFDEAAVTGHLARMLRVPTVSNLDSSLVDFARFAEFRSLLETLYPTVASNCERELAGATGVFYRWKGKTAGAPTVFMAHYDVVPADGEGWTHPPFAGEVDEDGILWGRGAIDTKITLCGIMEAAELHLKNGFVPEHDVYLAFSGDEEIMGPSALAVVDTLERRGVRPALVLDEGGAIVANVFPGVSKKCAVIGVTEKGIMNVRFTAKSAGGHSSAPPVRNPVGRLASAIRRVEDHPFPARLTPASRAMFDAMGRHSSFVYKILFANLWCFFPVLEKICSLTGGELNALVRTTCLFTTLDGSPAFNVMPQEASAGANLRLLSGETADSALARLERTVADPEIALSKQYGYEPSPSADLAGEGWRRVETAVRLTWPGVIVAPYLMVAATDSRHYCRICGTVLRFSAMELTKEERGTMHARDERIPSSKIPKTCAFFYRVIARS